MKAKVVSIEVQYKCPNCYFCFRLKGEEIPKASRLYECPECYSDITIANPIANVSTSSLSTQPDRLKASKILETAGFSKHEIEDMLVNIKTYIDVPDLVKQALTYSHDNCQTSIS